MEFLCQTQPLSLLPRGGLMGELMGPWPHSSKHYGTLASPVTTETSMVAGSQRVTWRCIAGEEPKEFPVTCRGGSLNATSSEMAQFAPTPGPCHISQSTSWESLSPSHKPLRPFSASWSKVQNRRKISVLLLNSCIKPKETLVSLWKHWLVHQFLSIWLVLLEVPCCPWFLYPVQSVLLQSSPLLASLSFIHPKFTFSTFFFLPSA